MPATKKVPEEACPDETRAVSKWRIQNKGGHAQQQRQSNPKNKTGNVSLFFFFFFFFFLNFKKFFFFFFFFFLQHLNFNFNFFFFSFVPSMEQNKNKKKIPRGARKEPAAPGRRNEKNSVPLETKTFHTEPPSMDPKICPIQLPFTW